MAPQGYGGRRGRAAGPRSPGERLGNNPVATNEIVADGDHWVVVSRAMTTTEKSEQGAGRHTTPLVVLDGVDKHFGDLHVLKDINLTVHSGEVVVVIGPSGSGKSTLCRTINRLETIDGGTISIDGKNLPEEGKDLAKLRSDVGMVFQSFNLFAHKSILDNVMLGPLKVRKKDKAEARSRAMELLERVGISAQADKMPAQLSGGQQQRVAIARALALQPKILLFDEPTSSLDPELTGEVLNVMRGLAEDGMTMVVVTHEIGFAATVGQRIAFLDHGRLMLNGVPEEVFGEPRHPRLAQFLETYLDRGAAMLL